MKMQIDYTLANVVGATGVLLATLLIVPALGQPFVSPIGGTPYVDWTIVNYVDQCHTPLCALGGFEDYRGGIYTYDGHKGIDFTLANFAKMASKVPVYAVADGRVRDVREDQRDDCSWATWGTPGGCTASDLDNFVRIEHLDGRVSEYLHLMKNSVEVNDEALVSAGTLIGYVGSSGYSSDPHLHFNLYWSMLDALAGTDPIETYFNPTSWWLNPVPYAGDVPGSLDHGITDHSPTPIELAARPVEHDAFYPGRDVWLWSNVHGIDLGDQLNYYFYRPNGAQDGDPISFTMDEDKKYAWETAVRTLPTTADGGTWTIHAKLNGATIWTDSFTVVTQAIWTGGAGNWYESFRWQPGVPNQYTDAVIQNGDVSLTSNALVGRANDILLGGPSSSATLRVQNGADLVSTAGRLGVQPGSQGTAIVSGAGSTWTMTGELAVGVAGTGSLFLNNGTVSAAGGVNIGTDGGIAGNGTIVGDVYNRGDVHPDPPVGPGITLFVDGDYTQHSSGNLFIDLDTGDYGRLAVNGNITLAGTLKVNAVLGLPWWVPQIGDSFDILNWTGTRSGTFDSIQLPSLLQSAARWDTSQLYSSGVISVISATGLTGNFNGDTRVDAADYITWRKGHGSVYTQYDFGLWRGNFGNTAGSGTEQTNVPEPVSFLLLLIGAALGRWTTSRRAFVKTPKS